MPSSPKFCGHCGAPQSGGSALCAGCGKQLAAAPTGWQAVVGDEAPALPSPASAAVGPVSWNTGLLLRQFLYRIPAMALTVPLAWVLHTYLLVFKNEGWQGFSHPIAAFLNVEGNGRASFVAFGVGSATLWSILFSVLRYGPRATLNTLLAAPRNCLAILSSKDPNSRLGLALGLALVLLGSNYFGLSSYSRLFFSGFSLFWGMGYLGSLLGALLGEFLTGLKGRFPWLRSLDVALMVRGLLAALPTGFGASWFLSGGLSDKLGWLALAFVVYTLYTHYQGQKGAPVQANLLLLLGLLGVLSTLLAHSGYADDGGWSEAVGNGGLTPDNVIRWWNSVGSEVVVGQGLIPSLGAALGAGLSPPLNPPKDGEDPDRIIGYILHLNANRFSLEAGKPATLAVTVYSVTARGQRALAAGAEIHVSNPSSALQVEPSSGSGTMQASLSWDGGQSDSTSISLEVQAAAGGTNHSNRVQVELAGQYELVVTVQSNFV